MFKIAASPALDRGTLSSLYIKVSFQYLHFFFIIFNSSNSVENGLSELHAGQVAPVVKLAAAGRGQVPVLVDGQLVAAHTSVGADTPVLARLEHKSFYLLWFSLL